MSYGCCQSRSGMDEPYIVQTKWQKQTKAAAIALVAIAILLGGVGVIGVGLSSTHAVVITGFSFVYYMAGMHFIMVGIGVFVASIIMALASTCRQEEDAEAVQTSPLQVRVNPPAPSGLASQTPRQRQAFTRQGYNTWAHRSSRS